MARARYEEPFVTGIAGAILAAAVLLPLGIVVGEARFDVEGDSHFALYVLSYLFDTGILLARSVASALSVTLLAAAIGITLGVLLAKTDVRGRRSALLIHAFPMFLPPFLLALGWFYLLGQEGVFGSSATSAALFSPVGAVVVIGLALAPIFTCLTMLGLAAVDPALEEAARLVAPPMRVLRSILLPATWHAQILAALMVFTLAFSELGVPMFLRVRTYSVAIFSRLAGIDPDPGEAVLLVIPLILVAFALLFFERVALGGRSFAVAGLRGHEGLPVTTLGRWQLPATIGVWTVAALSLLPMVGLLATGSRGGFHEVPKWIGRSLETSVLTAAIAAAIVAPLSVVVGRAIARGHPTSWLLDALATLAFITPAPLLGVGLIGLWNREATAVVYGSFAIIVIGYVTRYCGIGFRTMASSVAQTSPSLEEAAAVSGARYLRRLRRIVVPTSAHGLASGALLVFVFCLRDLETAVLYYPPGGEPLPVRILTLEANGPEPVVAALALIHVVVTGAVVATGGVLFFGKTAR